MGLNRAWVLLLITTSMSNGDSVTLKGYDLVYKQANSNAPRALLVNEKANPVKSVATAAFTACLFTQLDSYKDLTDVYLFSFSSQRNNQVDEIVMRLDYLHNQTTLYIHGNSTSVNVVPSLDEWTHICVSWESKGGRVDLHVNGARVGNGGPVEQGYILGGDGYFILGQDQDSFNGGFYPESGVHGKVTEFNLWNRVLTTIEVMEVQTCKLEGNVVSWSDSYWSLEGSLYKQKSVHQCGKSISQGCECVKSAKEQFENLLQTFKAEFQDGLKKTAQTISEIEETDGRAEQAITELTQRLESKETDITSLKNATLFLELRSTKNELEVCHQKEAIDECKQRVNSLDRSLKSEILVQKEAIDEYGKRIKSIDQRLKSEILVQQQVIGEYGQRVNIIDHSLKEILVQKEAKIDEYGKRINSIEQNLEKDIHDQKRATDECDKRLSSLDQRLKTEISSLIAEINAIKTKTNVFSCPTQFINLNGQCYYFSTYEADWDQALKDCQKLDSRASLLTVENSEEWSAIKKHIEQGSEVVWWWAGGTDTPSEGHWIWTSTNQLLRFNDWCPEEPNNADGNEGCLAVSNTCWSDVICTAKLAFICKIGETKVNRAET